MALGYDVQQIDDYLRSLALELWSMAAEREEPGSFFGRSELFDEMCRLREKYGSAVLPAPAGPNSLAASGEFHKAAGLLAAEEFQHLSELGPLFRRSFDHLRGKGAADGPAEA